MAITLKAKNRIQTSMKGVHKIQEELTIQEFIDLHTDFIRDKRLENLSQRTIEDHIYLFSFFTRWITKSHWFDGNQYEENITKQYLNKHIFNEYKEYMIYEKHYAACTVNVRLRPLKTYINWLNKNNFISINYNLFIKLLKTDEDKVRPLTKMEIKKLLETISDYTYARFRDSIITLTILDCGIRIKELLSLTIYDINEKDSYLNIRASVSKTRSERILPISKYTLNLIVQLKNIAIENNNEYLFLSTSGKNAIHTQDIFHNFRRYKAEAGIIQKCTPYILRHTFATEMVKQGVDIFTLQRIMGHKNITTTRQYIHLDNNDLIFKHNEIHILDHFLK